MAKTINCFIPFADENQVSATVAELKANALVKKIYLLQLEGAEGGVEGCEVIKIDGLTSTKTMKAIAEKADSDFVLYYQKYDNLKFGPFALDRMVKIASDTLSGMVYADHYNGDHYSEEGLPTSTKAPVIDY